MPEAKDNDQIITAPYNYLVSRVGKNFRQQLLVAFNSVLQTNEGALEVIGNVVDVLHNASLLQVQGAFPRKPDNSALRRGAPTAHLLFGIPQTINSANHAYFIAQKQLFALPSAVWPAALRVFTEELLALHNGQGLELYWRDERQVPTEDMFLDMVADKTGGLLRLGVRLLGLASEHEEAQSETALLVSVAREIGVVFQIRDDYLNLKSGEMASAKGSCDDLVEGKFSFPIVYALNTSLVKSESLPQDRNKLCSMPESDVGTHDNRFSSPIAKLIPSRQQLLAQLNARPTSPTLQAAILAQLEEAGSFAYTRGVIEALRGKIEERMLEVGIEDKVVEALLGRLVLDESGIS
ncbi:isoprenoid synthase domain-containing protein [Xylariales sp. AK1849]|nr:isoprenoid synthase domain-containing protein [Xylariales sp. AK1849]